VEVNQWGLHNTVITSIKKDGIEQIDFNAGQVGYDDPRDYLPEKIVELLDRKLPDESEAEEVAS